jgi:hypothetical protein
VERKKRDQFVQLVEAVDVLNADVTSAEKRELNIAADAQVVTEEVAEDADTLAVVDIEEAVR